MTLSTAPANVAFIDGGSRGNPGPSASAFALSIAGEHVVTKARHIGIATNNVAEYLALDYLVDYFSTYPKMHRGKLIYVCSDSKLLVNQMNRRWMVKDPKIYSIKNQIDTKMNASFMWMRFVYIPRAKNVEADKAVNLMLDETNEFTQALNWIHPVTCFRGDWKATHLDLLIDTEKKGA